jgi:hypothetical protein
MKTALARCARVSTCSTSDAEGNAMSVSGGAEFQVWREHEGVALDKNLISASRVSVCRLQIEDEIGGSVGAGGKDCRIEAALRINSRTGEAQL